MNIPLSIVLILLIVYSLFGGAVLMLIYKETHGRIVSYQDSPSNYGLHEKPFTVKVTSVIALSGWLFEHAQKRALVIMAHGYSRPGGKEGMVWHADYMYRAGFDVALFDHRGFGDSTGKGVTFGKTESEDLRAMYEYVIKNKEYANVPIILYGKSMGGATALITAGRYGIGDAVISAVPYKSFYSLIVNQAKKKKLPIWLIDPFIRFGLRLFIGNDYQEYAAEKQIGKINVPILLIGAKADEEINPNDFEELSLLNKKNIVYVSIKSGHDIRVDAPEEYKKTTLNFIDALFSSSKLKDQR